MIFGALGPDGFRWMTDCDIKMNAAEYQKLVLERGFKDALDEKYGENNYTLMQDGAPCHAANSTMLAFEGKIQVLEGWPPQSPDGNVDEMTWSIIGQKIAGFDWRGRVAKGIKETKAKLLEIARITIRSMSDRTINSLCASFQARLELIIECNGKSISQLLSSHIKHPRPDKGDVGAEVPSFFTLEDDQFIIEFERENREKKGKWKKLSKDEIWGERDHLRDTKLLKWRWTTLHTRMTNVRARMAQRGLLEYGERPTPAALAMILGQIVAEDAARGIVTQFNRPQEGPIEALAGIAVEHDGVAGPLALRPLRVVQAEPGGDAIFVLGPPEAIADVEARAGEPASADDVGETERAGGRVPGKNDVKGENGGPDGGDSCLEETLQEARAQREQDAEEPFMTPEDLARFERENPEVETVFTPFRMDTEASPRRVEDLMPFALPGFDEDEVVATALTRAGLERLPHAFDEVGGLGRVPGTLAEPPSPGHAVACAIRQEALSPRKATNRRRGAMTGSAFESPSCGPRPIGPPAFGAQPFGAQPLAPQPAQEGDTWTLERQVRHDWRQAGSKRKKQLKQMLAVAGAAQRDGEEFGGAAS
jgi:hypothetical protein